MGSFLNGKHIYDKQFSGAISSKLDIAEEKSLNWKIDLGKLLRMKQRFKKNEIMTDVGKRSRRPHMCLKGLLGETGENEEEEIMKEIT